MSGIKGYLDRSFGMLKKNTSQSKSLLFRFVPATLTIFQ